MTDRLWKNGWISGHCLTTGAHEGMVVLSPGGARYKECTMGADNPHDLDSYGCHCVCHKQRYDMRKFLVEQGLLGENDPLPGGPALVPASDDAPSVEASPPVVTAPAVVAPTPARAPGIPPDHPSEVPQMVGKRRARGSLEYEVKRTCDAWVMGDQELQLTPKLCASMIDPDNPPSTGAVDAVWRRWVKLGFATMESKLTRFTGYTPEGIEKGLHRMKFEADQRKRGRR